MEKIVGNIDSYSAFVGELRSHKESRWKKWRELGVDNCFLSGDYGQTELGDLIFL